MESYRVGMSLSVNCKAEKLHWRWLFMPLREKITHARVLSVRKEKRGYDLFLSQRESNNLHTKLKAKICTPTIDFKHIQLSLLKTVCFHSSLSPFGSRKLFFNLFWIDSRHEVDYWVRVDQNYRQEPDCFPQESVFGQERSLFNQLNVWLTC